MAEDAGNLPIYSDGAASSLSMADANLLNVHGSKDDKQESFASPVNDEGVTDVPLGSPREDVFVGADAGEIDGTINSGVRPGTRAMIIGIFLLLTAVAVVVSLAMTLPDQSDIGPRTFPTSAPTIDVLVEDVISYLVQAGVATRQTLEDPDTPQGKAAAWLADDDLLRVPVPMGVAASDMTGHALGYMYVVRYVMTLLVYQWDVPRWKTRVNFLEPFDTCFWHGGSLGLYDNERTVQQQNEIGGLVCEKTTRLPMWLDMEYNSMKGSIPTEIGLLSSLYILDLDFNDLTGSIPSEICQLTQLETLRLRGNHFTGPVPDCLWKMTTLFDLDVRENELTGSLPQDTTLCGMDRIQRFSLRENKFSGPIPTCIGEMAELRLLFLSNNSFVGEVPLEFSKLDKLQFLGLSENKLTGNPLNIVGGLPELVQLYLSNNEFWGDIDAALFEAPEFINVLELSHNNFTLAGQQFPVHLFKKPNLNVLDLSSNNLFGKFPEIPTLQKDETILQLLLLQKNKLYDAIPPSISNLHNLLHLDLSHNALTGEIPDSLFEMPLQRLFLSENPNFERGPVPAGIENLEQMTEISFKNTNRNGTLPQLTNLTMLTMMDFDNNHFRGGIPDTYAQKRRLRYLILSRNPLLSGAIPRFNGSQVLQVLLLDGTGIHGDFSAVCRLHAFNTSTIYDIPGADHVVVNCNQSSAEGALVTNCDCCHCCLSDNGSCSDPIVASLDWDYDQQFSRLERDFAINETQLTMPERPTD